MEKIKDGEQLFSEKETEQNDAIMQEENMVQAQSNDGSPILKFKDVKELEKAYVNLEKEFTKKCQELKSLKDNACDNALAPQESQEQEFLEFLEKNPVAKQFADEIKQELEMDKTTENDSSLMQAFDKVKAKHFKTNEELLNDSEFVDNYILTNSAITDKIVTNYLSKVVSNKTTPLMSNFGGGSVMVTPKSKPTSIKEAGDYMVALMNNK